MSAVRNQAAGQETRTDGAITLRNLHSNLSRLAEELAEAVKRFDSALEVGSLAPSTLEAMSPREFFVSLLELRQSRDRFFSQPFFGEPVWDVMLELMIARIDDRNVLASDLSAKLNSTSGKDANLIDDLVGAKLVETYDNAGNVDDPFLALSSEAARRMAELYRARMRG